MASTRTQHRNAVENELEPTGAARGPGRDAISVSEGGSLLRLAVALGAMSLTYVAWRAYQQFAAWRHGLDATTPGFQRYWMVPFLVEIVAIPIGGLVWYAWLLRGCGRCRVQRAAGGVAPGHEARHIWNLWVLVTMFAFALYWGGSFFAEQDAAWHQIAMRDTAFTPSHIVLFFYAFPLFIVLSVGAYLYAATRLPAIFRDRGFPLSFALTMTASLLLLVQVAENEWGHSFWIAEEIFSAPLHWGFVIFAFLGAGTFAVWLQTIPRLLELARDEAESATAPTAGATPPDERHNGGHGSTGAR